MRRRYRTTKVEIAWEKKIGCSLGTDTVNREGNPSGVLYPNLGGMGTNRKFFLRVLQVDRGKKKSRGGCWVKDPQTLKKRTRKHWDGVWFFTQKEEGVDADTKERGAVTDAK